MNRDEFTQLQKHWYQKLKELGFEDIESFDDRQELVWLSKSGPRPLADHGQSEAFYRLAGLFLHDYVFADPRDRQVWLSFANGASYRQIAREINGTLWCVFKTVKRIRSGPFEVYRKNVEKFNDED